MKVKKLFILILIIVFTMNFVTVTHAAGTINENESLSINTTYDDYNNYGYISSASDEDLWQITFSQTGMVTFYLGSIPNGCNYNMYLYKGNSNSSVAYSVNTSSQSEYIHCKVTPGVTYKIKITNATPFEFDTVDSYLFRAKRYDLKDVKVFTTNRDINTRADATDILSHVWSMGYQGAEYLNNTAAALYTVFPNTDIVVTSDHGAPGKLTFKDSYLYGAYNATGNSRALYTYATGTLSDVDLVIYSNCNSALSSEEYGDVYTQTLNRGAFLTIGWKTTIGVESSNIWLDAFFESCKNGNRVKIAMADADAAIQNSSYSSSYNDLRNRTPSPNDTYTRADSLVLN